MILPYSGTSEPVRVYYDGVNSRSRTEYYDGQDVTIFLPTEYGYGTQYIVIPETYNNSTQLNVRSCVQINGTAASPISLQSFIPDLSVFTLVGTTHKRGEQVEDWVYSYQQDGRNNTYHLYVSPTRSAPVQFHMFGYDYLLGSHYDEYVLNFLTWRPGAVPDPVVFAAPQMPCGNFPGPGMSLSTTRGALALLEQPQKLEKETAEHFAAFASKYKKNYTSPTDARQRVNTFRHNKRFIESMNRRHLSYTLAVNHLADLTAAELKAMRGSVSSRRRPDQQHSPKLSSARPASLDWRDTGAVSPVKDQGICGSCWSFATAQTIESAQYIKTGEMVPLSPQALVDCSWGFGNNGCDGGEAERAFGWILQQGGIPSEASYGVYEMADGLCHNMNADVGARIASYVNVTSGDLDAVADALFNNGPLSIAIDAGHMSFVFYSSGVYYEPACGNTPDDLDHAVLAIGYGVDPTEGPYWIVKNSWSEYWGDNGYVKMSQKDNNCGVATDANFVNIA